MGFINLKCLYIYLSIVIGGGGGQRHISYFLFFVIKWHMFNKGSWSDFSEQHTFVNNYYR